LEDTNRDAEGYIDFETLYGIKGAGLANIVANAQDVEGLGRRTEKQLKTVITFNDGLQLFFLCIEHIC
jgi:Sortilin, neurotensin receptor 3,